MKLSQSQIPSNRRFGFFFATVFGLISFYLFYQDMLGFSLSSIFLSFILVGITLIKPEFLLPFNRAWMYLGYILSLFISPIVLALIFFGLFTPLSLLMRISGRDELRMKLSKRASHWKTYDKNDLHDNNYKNQF